MTQLDILVHIRTTEGEPLALRAAHALVRRTGGYLYGLYVAPLGAVAFSTPETVVFQATEADRLYQQALARRAWWQQQLAAADVQGDWLVAQGEPVEALCLAARWCDLIVAERPTLNPDAPLGWGTVSRTVFGAGAPVLVVPETASVKTIGETVLVAWNHSREAMRAVRGALPLLARAGRVVVADGTPQEDRLVMRHQPRLDLAGWFERRGIRAEFRSFVPKGEPGHGILALARDIEADVIVMGAWGHSRISELVLGGATRTLFQHSDRPLLVAH